MAKKLFNELESVTHHSISDFLLDEEANIPKGRLLTIGSLMVVLACVLGVEDAFAGHRSHVSHSSHRSGSGHSSHSSGGGGHSSHSSHVSHSSHNSGSGTHSSHSSHNSGGYIHSNHSSVVHSIHSSHSSSYNYHSNSAPDTNTPSVSNPVSPGMIRIPQTLPDTIPVE